MTDKDYSPLSTSSVRALNDKLYEKRKVAALEIERMVKEFMATNNTSQIKRLLKVLGFDFALSQNPNSRKGGLIGLAAIAIALGKDSGTYVNDLVKPVLSCFFDSDSRVRYYGCESLYNIVKVARSAVLPYFNDIFDGLSKLAADPDQNVRSGSELLDRLMKDIVTESCAFDMVAFMPLIRERIYTKNPFARQFIVSWIMTLDAVPDIDMLIFLPEILDGLFHILGEPNTEIRKMCEAALGEFLRGIHKSPNRVDYSGMINILIAHSQSIDDVIQYTAVIWLKEFVLLSGRTMLPFASGIITAVLPCLSYDDDSRKSLRTNLTAQTLGLPKVCSFSEINLVFPSFTYQTFSTLCQGACGNRIWSLEDSTCMLNLQTVKADFPDIREAARAVNSSLMRLVGPADDRDLGDTKESAGTDVSKSRESETEDRHDNDSGVEDSNSGTTDLNTNSAIQLDISSMVEVLTRQLLHNSMQTRIAALRWIYHLHIKTPNKIFRHVDELFPLLLKTLSDPSDEVVLLDLEVLAEISSSPAGSMGSIPPDPTVHPGSVKKTEELSQSMNAYFTKFMVSLLKLFSTDRQLLEDRGAFIIRQLCLLLRSEHIYQCCSEILQTEEDLKFAAHMIQTLSTILLTSTELFELRTQLKDLKTEESCTLFCCLYKSWCHNPVSTVALCLISQNYEHACNLLTMFGDLEVTVEFLTEIDKLVQLLESPIFTYLRLQLLDINQNHHLIKSLYGLLMLLPQSDAFRTLRHRLECVPNLNILRPEERFQRNSVKTRPALTKVNFQELREHFKSIQDRHRASRRKPRVPTDPDHR